MLDKRFYYQDRGNFDPSFQYWCQKHYLHGKECDVVIQSTHLVQHTQRHLYTGFLTYCLINFALTTCQSEMSRTQKFVNICRGRSTIDRETKQVNCYIFII